MFFYAHQLTRVEYGHYQAFWAQLNIFNAVVCLGIAMFTITYSPEKIQLLIKQIKPRFYLGYFLFLISCSLLFGWLQYENNLTFPWPVLFLIAFALCNISDAFLIAFRNFKSLVTINLFYAIGFFGIHYAFLIHTFNFNSLLTWLLPLLLLKLIFSSWVLYKHNKKTQFEISNVKISLKGMRSLWQHLYFYDILQISSLWLDKFIISILMSSKETGIYISGTLNIPFLPIIFSAITSSALIHLSERQKKGDRIRIANTIGKILSSVAFPVTVFLIFFRKEFIVFCFSDKYLASVPIFLFSILIIPMRAYGHTVLLQNMEQGKIINQGAILDVGVAIILMYPLYLWLGLPGVALSFVFSTLIQAVFYGLKTQKLLDISIWKLYPILNWAKKAVFFTALGFILYYWLPNTWSDTVRLFVGFGIMAVFTVIILLWEFKKVDQSLSASD